MISKWKKYMSYLTPISLEKGKGKNSDLELLLVNNRLQLTTDKAVYSWEDLYYPFSYALNKIKKRLINVESCLIVGMGMGSITKILYSIHNKKNIRYTAIETEPLIIDWAKKYLPNQLHQNTTWMNEDALKAISKIDERFDLICIDILYLT
jgi:spermidine synthase